MKEEEQAREVDDRLDALVALAVPLLRKRDEAVKHRAASGIEQRWLDDEIAYDGMDGESQPKGAMIDYATGTLYTGRESREAPRSKVLVNIIRGRTETAVGRFCEIMLPTDEKNFGVENTPVPDLVNQLDDDRMAMQGGKPILDAKGQQKRISDVAKNEIEIARTKAAKMEEEIYDQFVECDMNAQERKVIFQAAKLGTGILKGPSVTEKLRRSWYPQQTSDGKTIYRIKSVPDNAPASRWVDCWNIYPSPGTTDDIQRTCEYMWERDEILPRDVEKLLDSEEYETEQLLQILREAPQRTSITTDRKGTRTMSKAPGEKGGAYEYWEYNGQIDREDLEAMGLEIPEDIVTPMISVCVIFINDRPVKISLSTLDTGEIPYDFFQWSKNSDKSPWGIGVVRQLIWLQGIVTAAWRAMMDNAGDSAGANVVVSDLLTPADGHYLIGGKRIWMADEDVEDVRRAFAQFQLTSTQPQLQAIIELALKFTDLETALPTIFQGEIQKLPETLGQTNIMVDSSNIGLRHRVKIFDDQVTLPHVTRYYNWNMMYSQKDEIKGDSRVFARGVRVLLEKDQQAQIIIELIKLKQDPDFRQRVNWRRTIDEYLKLRKVGFLLNLPDEQKTYDENASQEQPEDPRVTAAKIMAEAKIEEKKLQATSDMEELKFKADEAKLDREFKLQMKTMDRDMAMMDYSTKYNISLDKLKVQLAISDRSLSTQEKLSDKKATPEVDEPPTEPEGRAPTGQSFER